MYHPVVSVKDKRFSIYKIESYCLLISIGQNRLRISCMDRVTNRCLLVESYRMEVANSVDYLHALQQLFKAHAFLAASSWQRVTLCFENQHYTLIPAALFQAKNTAEYLQYAIDVGGHKTAHCIHTDLGLAIAFAIDDKIEHWLRSEYVPEKCYTVHQASSLIAGSVAYMKNKKSRTTTSVFVCVETAHLHITVVEKDKLLYYNRFAYGSSDDLLQYILVVMYTLALDPGVHSVIALGFWGKAF
eukprot:gene714-885_t